ncbi:MAG: amidinotransferase [Acidobacteria bacterium]|nr:amidinotransferase [Acidobacteriota bacterium]
MTPARVIRTTAELESLLGEGPLESRVEPRHILMCTPDYFDVVDVKNAFMHGNIGSVDRSKAREQWDALARAFESAGHEVLTLPGVEGCEDMVFAANQVLPGMGDDGRPYVVPSHMRHPSRRREVPAIRAWFEERGYRILELPESVPYFEGQGDAIWHPGRRLLWGGYGQRTAVEAYEALSELIETPVVVLELVHPSFYHLDTAFCALSDDAVLVYPDAFSDEGMALIRRGFDRVIEASEPEATSGFACNAHVLDGRTVVIQSGSPEVVAALRANGFDIVEVETGEFIKSGGSVFCMKMMVY